MSNQAETHPSTASGPTGHDPADPIGPPTRTMVVSSIPTPLDSERRRTLLLGAIGVLALVAAAYVVRVGPRNLVGLADAEGLAAAPIEPVRDAAPEVPEPRPPPTLSTANNVDEPDLESEVETDGQPGVGADATPVGPVESIEDVVATDTGAAVIDVTANDHFDTRTAQGWVVRQIFDDDPNGDVTIEGDEVRYVADPTFSGIDEFEYEACQGQVCERATVSVYVTAPPRSTRFVYRPRPLTPAASDGPAPVDAGTNVAIAIDGAARDGAPTGALVRLTIASPEQSGTITIAPADGVAQPTAYLEVDRANRHVSRVVRVPVDPSGQLVIGVGSGGVVAIDQLGVYVPTAWSSEGRFVAVTEALIGKLDTEVDGRVLRVVASDHPEIPETGAGFAVVRVEANVGPDGGQIVVGAQTHTDADQQMMWPNWGESRNAVSEMVVPLSRNGSFELKYLGGSDITITALGYITDATAPVSSAGLFVPIEPTSAERFSPPTRFPVSPVQYGGRIVGYHLD